MLVEAIVTRQDKDYVELRDINPIFDKFRLHKNSKVYQVNITQKIKTLSKLQRTDVRDRRNLHVKIETNNPQGFYTALSRAGFALKKTKPKQRN